jgi:hypothetical protein
MELGFSAGLGATALTKIIDDNIGISESVERRQEGREWERLENDVQTGRLGILQALHIVVRKQLQKERRDIPWYAFMERRRLKNSERNRHLAIDQILAATSLQTSGISFRNLCRALDEAARIVTKKRGSNHPLPSGPQARALADDILQQCHTLPP